MKFFTDCYFTETEKVDMLGSTYRVYLNEQRVENQRNEASQLRQRERELKEAERTSRELAFDRKIRFIGLAVFTLVTLFITLSSQLGSW